jgi:hypothetical protein
VQFHDELSLSQKTAAVKAGHTKEFPDRYVRPLPR